MIVVYLIGTIPSITAEYLGHYSYCILVLVYGPSLINGCAAQETVVGT